MAVKIELKRSAVPGKIPSLDQLSLGELAINTYDGKIFFKQDTGTTQSIVQVALTAGTGSQNVASASYADYAAVAGVANSAPGYTPVLTFTTFSSSYNTGSFSGSFSGDGSKLFGIISASYASTASYVSGSGDILYSGRTTVTRQIGGWNVGDSLSGLTLSQIIEQELAPYTPPTVGASVSPSLSEYNQTNVTYNVTGTWHQNVGTPNFVSASVSYSRDNVSFTAIPNTVSGTTTDKTVSATVTLNTSGSDNRPVYFLVQFLDAELSSATTTSTFKSYAAPTANLSLSISPSLYSGNYSLRSLSTPSTVSVSGTITRNSPNVPLSQYKIQREFDSAGFVDLSSLTNIGSSGGSITPAVSDTTSPTNVTTIQYRAFVTDGQYPSGQAVNYVSTYYIYQPVFYGMTSYSSISSLDVSTLSIVNRSYTNSSSDKAINGLTFVANNNRFCYAYDSSYGNLSIFLDTGTNYNLLPNFTVGTKSVTFADGTIKTYNVYLYSSVVSSGTYIINIS